jgi:phosphoribosyl-ATP pyrophosphohydrolase/phosphoribosyl-AMP cyclohydrolase/histidinol dehydrogenase
MTSTPYPSFLRCDPADPGRGLALAAVGRCRLRPFSRHGLARLRPLADKILEANLRQASCLDGEQERRGGLAAASRKKEDGGDDEDDEESRKRARKKFMKEGSALAASYLEEAFAGAHRAAGAVDVEVVLAARDVAATRGCLARCFLDAGCQAVVVEAADADAEEGEDGRGGGSPTAILEEALHVLDAALVPPDRVCAHFRYEPTPDFYRSVDRALGGGTCGSASVELPPEDSNEQTVMSVLESVLGGTSGGSGGSITVHVPAGSLSPAEVGRACRHVQHLLNQKDRQHQRHHPSASTVALVDPTARQLGEAYAACLGTDRPDGLFATVVCSRANEALGLVYSSTESIVASLETGRGVYWSRSRGGLWRKGDTSGHSQTLHLVEADCDGDALRFTVTQESPGSGAGGGADYDPPAFCHLKTLTCWGMPRGLRMLEMTLRERLRDAPEGSYTKRLFEDDELLRNKLVEEAQELSEARDPGHVAEELADVLYFALARAVKAGVGLDDAVAELDRRARKVTRRRGDGKASRVAAADAILQGKNKEEEERQNQQESPPPGGEEGRAT